MSQVGKELEEIYGFNITWIQIYMYNFGFDLMKYSKNWKTIVEDRSYEKGIIRNRIYLKWNYLINIAFRR